MSDVQQHTDPAVHAAAHYEALRQHAVARQGLAARLGLALLLRYGLAAWVEHWPNRPAPTPAPAARALAPIPLPEDTSAAVIHVLAAMALSHVQELHA